MTDEKENTSSDEARAKAAAEADKVRDDNRRAEELHSIAVRKAEADARTAVATATKTGRRRRALVRLRHVTGDIDSSFEPTAKQPARNILPHPDRRSTRNRGRLYAAHALAAVISDRRERTNLFQRRFTARRPINLAFARRAGIVLGLWQRIWRLALARRLGRLASTRWLRRLLGLGRLPC